MPLIEYFIAETRGGDGGRVDEECLDFVKSRETDAVAVDVPASATGAGVRGRKTGRRGRGGSGGVGCSFRILRRHCTVSFAGHPSDELEDSSSGGVSVRLGRVDMIVLGFEEHEDRRPFGEDSWW